MRISPVAARSPVTHTGSPHDSMNYAREQLDRLFAFDAASSVIFGVLSILAPHGVLVKIGGGFYNHDVHEILRCVF